MTELTALAGEAGPKAVQYAGLAVAIGTVVAHRLLAAVRRDGTPVPPAADARLVRVALVSALIVCVASGLRLVGHTIAAFGLDDGLTAESLRLMALESRWGAAWQWQWWTAVLVFGAAIIVRLASGRGWWVLAGAAVASALATPLLGHASGSVARTLLHGAHLLAVAAWLGTLMVIVLIDPLVKTAQRADMGTLTAVVSRFSPIALAAGAVVLATGTIAAAAYVPSPGDLISTAYGRVLAVKLTLVAAILACGFGNWRRSRLGCAPWPRLMRIEAILALLTLVASSVLTETEHP